MLQILNKLTALRNHIEELRPGFSPHDFEEWKRTALQLVETVAGNGETTSDSDGHVRLSPRETEVMRMMLDGRRLKEIAAHLGISVKTVTTHRARLLRKLKLSDNLGLYRYGVRNGIISL